MALVDYRGFRLIAISYLPINNSTLIYGSNDGGQSIFARSSVMNRMMKRASKILNIKEHMCGYYAERRKLLWSAADIEGHRGTVRGLPTLYCTLASSTALCCSTTVQYCTVAICSHA
jgi:hypothetical protein